MRLPLATVLLVLLGILSPAGLVAAAPHSDEDVAEARRVADDARDRARRQFNPFTTTTSTDPFAPSFPTATGFPGPLPTATSTVDPTVGIPVPPAWQSQVNVTKEMNILTSTSLDQCITSLENRGVISTLMKVCDGSAGQLWTPNDARGVTWKNVGTGDVVSIRDWTGFESVQYASLVLAQGNWRPTNPSPCSATCGWGTFTVDQICVNANGVPPVAWYSAYCDPDRKGLSVYQCSLIPACNITEASWTDWSDCSTTCGAGIQQRLCVEGFGTNTTCSVLAQNAIDQGQQGDTKLCDDSADNWIGDCPVDGGYSAWSSCSVTCGYGIQQRACNNPPPSNGGKNCSELEPTLGPSIATCNAGPCEPVNGNYSEWSDCSVTCGIGVQSRKCDNPVPAGTGSDCTGLGPNIRTCEQPDCNATTTTTTTTTSTSTTFVGGTTPAGFLSTAVTTATGTGTDGPDTSPTATGSVPPVAPDGALPPGGQATTTAAAADQTSTGLPPVGSGDLPPGAQTGGSSSGKKKRKAVDAEDCLEEQDWSSALTGISAFHMSLVVIPCVAVAVVVARSIAVRSSTRKAQANIPQ